MNPYVASSLPAKPHQARIVRWWKMAGLAAMLGGLLMCFAVGVGVGYYLGWNEGYDASFEAHAGLAK